MWFQQACLTLEENLMNNDNLIRLAATLDSQAMSGACHRVFMNPGSADSLLKRAIDFLRVLLRAA
jgi:hypothetical protein